MLKAHRRSVTENLRPGRGKSQSAPRGGRSLQRKRCLLWCVVLAQPSEAWLQLEMMRKHTPGLSQGTEHHASTLGIPERDAPAAARLEEAARAAKLVLEQPSEELPDDFACKPFGSTWASDAFGRIWQPPAWSSSSLVRCGRSRSVCFLAPFDSLTLSRCAPGVPGRSERPDYLSAAVDPSFGVEAIGHGQPRNGCQKREMCLHQLWICGAACHGRSCCSVWTPLRRFRPGCRFTLNFATVRLLLPGLRRFEKLCLWPGAAWMHTAGGGAT